MCENGRERKQYQYVMKANCYRDGLLFFVEIPNNFYEKVDGHETGVILISNDTPSNLWS